MKEEKSIMSMNLRRCSNMCYLIAKNKNSHGCYAFKTKHGKQLVEMKKRMNMKVANKGIQLVTISRPTAILRSCTKHSMLDNFLGL